MNVRELIEELQRLDPDLLVLAQGTGTDCSRPVGSVGTATIQRCDDAGTVFDNGATKAVAFVYVDFGKMKGATS